MTPLLFLVFLYLWIAFVGGTVGSFLNVVVYRVPAGMSVVHPPSRCPVCEHAIRWYDNIPVLGWLWLRGRCRDCGTSISPRYPIVEAITAVAFVAVAYADGVPRAWQEALIAVRSDVTMSEFGFVCTRYLLHIALLCTVWTAGLMQFDRQVPPLAMVIVTGATLWLAVSAMGIVWPWPPHLPYISYFKPIDTPVMASLVTLFSMVSTYFWTWREDETFRHRWTFAEVTFIAALVIPAGSMQFVVVGAVAIGLVSAIVSRRANYPLLCLAAAILIHLVGPSLVRQLTPDSSHWHSFTRGFAAAWRNWYPLAYCGLIVLMTEACVVIRRRTIPDPIEEVPAMPSENEADERGQEPLE